MGDHYLQRIIEAADAGQPVPWLMIFTPAMIVTGYPSSQRAFAEEFENADAVHMFGSHMPVRSRGSKGKAEDERAWSEAQSDAAERAKPVHAAVSEGPGEGICLTDAAGTFSDGTKVAFDCIRIPFSAISAWTTGQQEVLERPKDGGWFVGGAFPLPGGN